MDRSPYRIERDILEVIGELPTRIPKTDEKHVSLGVISKKVHVYTGTPIAAVVSIMCRISCKVARPPPGLKCEEIAMDIHLGVDFPSLEIVLQGTLHQADHIRPDADTRRYKFVLRGVFYDTANDRIRIRNIRGVGLGNGRNGQQKH